jgi:thermostable 8-oxoguanine DNA glycosylase
LILDRFVARWLAGNARVSLNPGFWSSNTYGRYLELLGSWAEALGITPDEVEMCIFQAEADTTGNQWASAP